MLNCSRLNSFLLRVETRQRFPFSPLLVNIVLEILASTMRYGTVVGKEEIKQLPFKDDIIIYLENLNEATDTKSPKINI